VKTKRRTEITVETDRVLVVRRRRGGPVTAWCPDCRNQVPMLTPDEAGAVARISMRAIYRRVEASGLHFAETPQGLLLVCLNSLRRL
jgi:hypothetical protein